MNHRKIYSIIFLLVVFAGFSAAREQKKDEWVSLFDGKSLNGKRGLNYTTWLLERE